MVLYVKLTNGDWRYCEWDDDEMLELYGSYDIAEIEKAKEIKEAMGDEVEVVYNNCCNWGAFGKIEVC